MGWAGALQPRTVPLLRCAPIAAIPWFSMGVWPLNGLDELAAAIGNLF
jgi:hypothetical protein